MMGVEYSCRRARAEALLIGGVEWDSVAIADCG